mmetsp:Transcript_1167/g.3298  ORF Transcript_1167/g.3298 Transcript_1167/m.3298 type:complete len:179 (-) Transcript_1167:236-772(-)
MTDDSMLAGLRIAYARELALYRRYHTRKANVALHAVCVPIEWLAFLVFAASASPVAQLRPAWVIQAVIALATGPLHPPATFAGVPALFALAWLAEAIVEALPSFVARAAAAFTAWTVSWLLQVPVGHYLIEGNRPSMTEALTAASVFFSVPLAWDAFASMRRNVTLSDASSNARLWWW